MNFCCGKCYMGGFVGPEAMLERLINPKVKRWVAGIGILARIASRFPQMAYVGLVSSLQSEWQYLCCVVPGAERFLGAILQVSEPVDEALRQLLSHGLKSVGIAILNPIISAPLLHQCSVDAYNILVKGLQDGGGLNAEAHKAVVKATGNEACTARLKEEQVNLDGLKGSGRRKVAKRLERMGKTWAWLSVVPSCFDGTELSREEFQDNHAICYGLRPRDLPEHRNGCNEPFTVAHGLTCKKGGFVGQWHDDVCKELAHLCSMALTPS